jgi:hypothetical protein
LGTFKTDSKGNVLLPAFKVLKSGTYVIEIATKGGKKYFTKIVVVNNKKR